MHLPMSANMPNFVTLGQTMYVSVVENSKNWGPLAPCPLGMDSVAYLNKPLPHMCYHAKLGHSTSKGL